MNKLQGCSCILVLGLYAASAKANLLTNGSFEAAGSNVCQAGATTLAGWIVSAGNIDVVNGSGNNGCYASIVPDGTNYIDLTGSFYAGAGSIYQDISTTAGTNYTLSFYFGGNSAWQYLGYGNDGAVKSMNALINGTIAGTYSIDTTGLAINNPGWSQKYLNFTASSSTTRIGFNSLDTTGVFGPLLDGVNVDVSVPEPATFGIFASGLLSLLAMRRKRKQG